MESSRTIWAIVGLLCLAPGLVQAQESPSDMLVKVYGLSPERPDSYTFTHVIHYNLEQLVSGGEGQPLNKIKGNMDLYYTPGDSAYGRVVEVEGGNMSHIGDLALGMKYTLTTMGEAKIGSENKLNAIVADTLQMSRVSGDREIDGRMSAHYWHEEGSTIDELWADSQASEEEVSIGRLWPRFEPGFASLASGTYVGLATRWVSIDTKFSREPRTLLLFKGSEALESPVVVSLKGFVFPVTEAETMRQRLEAERN
ncbi:hypothetical protein N9C70_02925 [Flavobacteriales bacterium]|jgi:hypothetical protein|nr:hypothetical protein [Flavobacteriales bacterium]